MPVVDIAVAGTKSFRLQWTGGEGAEELDVKRVDAGEPADVASDLPATATQFEFEAFLPAVAGAEFVVEACNGAGCTASGPAVVMAQMVLDAIGYVKDAVGDAADFMGWVVDVSANGDTVAVGVPQEDSSGAGVDPTRPSADETPGSGAVLHFERQPTGSYELSAVVKASEPGQGEAFGYSLALSGDGNHLVVGAPYEAGSGSGVDPSVDDDLPLAGAAYLFWRDPEGGWEGLGYLKAPSTDPGDFFGHSVALSADGRTLVVGAPAEDGPAGDEQDPSEDSLPSSGAVYVY